MFPLCDLMKKKKYIPLIIVITIAATGGVLWKRSQMSYSDYLSKEKNKDMTVTSKNIDIPKHYNKKLSEHVKFDMDIIYDADLNEFYYADATGKYVDEEKWKKYFQDVRGTFIGVEDQADYDRNGNEITSHIWKWNNEDFLRCGKNEGCFTAEGIMLHIFIQAFSEEKNDTLFNVDKYKNAPDIRGMSRDEAEKKTYEILKDKLGVSMDNAVRVDTYSMDFKTMEEEEKRTLAINPDAEPMWDWNEEKSGYYIKYMQVYQNTPIIWENTIGEDDIYTPIRVYYTQEGVLQALMYDNWFDIAGTDKKADIRELDKIIDSLTLKYNAIEDEDITIRECKLYEYPQLQSENSYMLIPVWKVTVLHKYDEGHEQEDILVYDAVTGEECTSLEGR